jgi:transposase
VIGAPPSGRVYLCLGATDMRRSFDGLGAIVQQVMEQDPFSGAWFVLRHRRGDRLKILCWDGSGYCLYYKRLEQGTFAFPSLDEGVMSLSGAQLSLLLEGIDWRRLVARSLPTPQAAA